MNSMNSNMNPNMNNIMEINDMINMNVSHNQQPQLETDVYLEEAKEDKEKSGHFKEIMKNYNIVLVIVLALAWNDVVKYYLNRAIKFQNLSHYYYIYYAVALTLVVYITTKYLHFM